MSERGGQSPEGAERCLASVLLCILIALTLVAPAIFIAAEANHHCSGEGCPICHEIVQCIHAEEQIGTGAGAVASLVATTSVVACVSVPVFLSPALSRTPVSLRVRLDI